MNLPPHAYVVDDDPLLCQAIKNILDAHGVNSTLCDDGETLLAEESYKPGCILLDMRMAKIGGMAVLNTLRERQADLKIIVISGTVGVGRAVEAMKLGADDLLEKPINEAALIAALERTWTGRNHRLRNQGRAISED